MISPERVSIEQENLFRQDAISGHALAQVWRAEHRIAKATAAPIEEVMAAMTRLNYPDDDVFAMHLALEEAMVNAIKHGNRHDPRKQVRITCEASTLCVRVRIEDQGSGFDPRQVPDPTAPENLERPSGRGVMLMRLYMTSVHFNRRGNCVTLCKNRTTG